MVPAGPNGRSRSSKNCRKPRGVTAPVKIRFNGSISSVTVSASSAGLAKQLVLAQYGGQVDVLSVTRA